MHVNIKNIWINKSTVSQRSVGGITDAVAVTCWNIVTRRYNPLPKCPPLDQPLMRRLLHYTATWTMPLRQSYDVASHVRRDRPALYTVSSTRNSFLSVTLQYSFTIITITFYRQSLLTLIALLTYFWRAHVRLSCAIMIELCLLYNNYLIIEGFNSWRALFNTDQFHWSISEIFTSFYCSRNICTIAHYKSLWWQVCQHHWVAALSPSSFISLRMPIMTEKWNL